jgi:glycosyltransferase involved in cell wall biosynthesis
VTDRLRVGVYNRFWPTAGGGERFAGGIAEALARHHDVDLIGHDDLDPAVVSERLQLDLTAVGTRIVDRSPTAVERASAAYDLFVNASYGSLDRCAARWGLYVVHFPVAPPFPPSRWRPKALGALERLARATGVDLAPARWRRGAYAPERLGALTRRWTDGAAELELDPATAGRLLSVVVVRPPDGPPVPLELTVGTGTATATGTGAGTVGRGAIRPRRHRWWPFQQVTAVVPTRPDGAVPAPVLTLASPTHRPDGPASDRRDLGVSVVAVTVGGRWARLLQALHQPLGSPGIDLGFLDSYGLVASNSAFTARWVERRWGRAGVVLPPPVTAYEPGAKGPLVLHVGRFFPPGAGHSKRQAELVEAFRRLLAGSGAEGWELHLVGGCDDAGQAYLDEVCALAAGLPVTVHANAPAATLRDLLARASIYWHATGLGEDPDEHPERFEHFGISTVEAMSAGAVPVAIAAAGQLEVFDDGVEGHHFKDLDGLVAATAALVADPDRRAVMSARARNRAVSYGRAAFAERLDALVEGLTSAGSPPT